MRKVSPISRIGVTQFVFLPNSKSHPVDTSISGTLFTNCCIELLKGEVKNVGSSVMSVNSSQPLNIIFGVVIPTGVVIAGKLSGRCFKYHISFQISEIGLEVVDSVEYLLNAHIFHSDSKHKQIGKV